MEAIKAKKVIHETMVEARGQNENSQFFMPTLKTSLKQEASQKIDLPFYRHFFSKATFLHFWYSLSKLEFHFLIIF